MFPWLMLALSVFFFVLSFFTVGLAGFIQFCFSMVILGFSVGFLAARRASKHLPTIR